MNSTASSVKRPDPKTLLSTLWVFVTVNYIFCDVVTLMNPNDLRNIISGTVGNIQMSESFLLGAAIMMEIPFVMILLSRLLNYGTCRIANVIAASIMTIVQVASLFAGTRPTPHYHFYSAIEISCTVFILLYALKFKLPNVKSE